MFWVWIDPDIGDPVSDAEIEAAKACADAINDLYGPFASVEAACGVIDREYPALARLGAKVRYAVD